MKIEVTTTGNGSPAIVLSEVYSGVGIKTDMGLFGVAQRDDGIEVMLDRKLVWSSNELKAKFSEPVRLPDGSGFMTASLPLPKNHWLYADGYNEAPPPMLIPSPYAGSQEELATQIRTAARYAIRGATMNGKEKDFDPDALIQNLVVGMLGPWQSGRHRE